MIEEGGKEIHIHAHLVEACKRNDRKAQYQLYDLYYKSMYNTSLRLVNNEMIAEDLMQDSFVSAFIHIKKFSHDVSFGAWLKRIVINKSIDFLKKRKLEFTELKENYLSSPEHSIEEESIKYKAKQALEGIAKLPDGYRIVMNLYLLEGYDHEEIGQILKISPSTSRSQYTRAKRKLLEILKNN